MIVLQLELNEVNRVLTALGELKYRESFDLVQKISTQAQGQININDQTNATVAAKSGEPNDTATNEPTVQ